MKRTLVLKRLSASDLTIFEHQFRHTSGAKQKGINLDKAVFLGEIYPNLRERLATGKVRIPLELHIYGPGCAGLHSQQRKILLQTKNIRLNGEFIKNPIDEDARYDALEKDDLAVMELVGDDAPYAATLFLLSKHDDRDVDLHTALMDAYGAGFSARKGMQVMRDVDLSRIVEPLGLPDDHPVLDFIDGEALEDAAQGGIDGIRTLRSRRRARGVSLDELERAKRNAERNGRLGEELLNAWLEDQEDTGVVAGFDWVADKNAVAPFDFTILDADGEVMRLIDAKSTSGDFGNKIHVSVAELIEMVHGDKPYDLYRLYGVSDYMAKFRVAENVGPILSDVLTALEALPKGVQADGISIDPSILPFGDEREIDLREPHDFEETDQPQLFEEGID